MLSRRRRFGQPSYAPLATDAQMLLLVLLAARMPRRLPDPVRRTIPCLEMPATARMSAFARRAAHGECKMGSLVKLSSNSGSASLRKSRVAMHTTRWLTSIAHGDSCASRVLS